MCSYSRKKCICSSNCLYKSKFMMAVSFFYIDPVSRMAEQVHLESRRTGKIWFDVKPPHVDYLRSNNGTELILQTFSSTKGTKGIFSVSSCICSQYS